MSAMKRLGLVSLVLLLATACGDEPSVDDDLEPAVERDPLDQAARELQLLHNGHDMLAMKFPKRSPQKLVERMEWFRGAVGTCDRYERFETFGPKLVRFLYHCERGQLEALIGVDDNGRVNELRTGARGIDPPMRVRQAANRWLESADADAAVKDCHIDRVHLGSVSGALFVLSCPAGEKTLIFEIDREGEPRRMEIIDHAKDAWRVPANVG
jgi:hypothetical protein